MAALLVASGVTALPATAQNVAISTNGTPTYAKQLAVPPGIAGMAPNVSLLYSGGDVNGPLGKGWTLQGISSITRCPSTKPIDGAARAVTYGVDDKLCLDGQRLIQTDANGAVLTSGVPIDAAHPFQTGDSAGGSGLVREYRTEKDMYARIRAYGAAGNDPLNGPAYFRVWTKAGQLFEYGAAGDARANASITANNKVVTWAVSRIFDSAGNHMDFQYEQRDVPWGTALTWNSQAPWAGHEWNLLEIRYTGHGEGQEPVNKVVFEYSDRPDTPGRAQDRAEAYHMGQKKVSIRRLDAVRTYINWPASAGVKPASAVAVKAYKLGYENNPVNGRSRLNKITECSGSNDALCLPPTTFSYSDGSGAQYKLNDSFGAGPLATLPMQSAAGDLGVLTGNFLGSGRTDVLRWSDNPAQNQLFRSDGNGNFSQVANFNITDQNLFKSNGCYTAIAVDFNGDGATDILRIMKSTSNGVNCGAVQNILYLSKGDGTFTAKPMNGIDFSQVAAVVRSVPHCRGDIPALVRTPSAARHEGAPASPAAISCPEGWDYYYSQNEGLNFHLLDLNNDGLLDIVTTKVPAYQQMPSPQQADDLCGGMVCTHVYLAQADGSFAEKADSNVRGHSLYGIPGTKDSTYHQRPFIGDINGDGMADVVADSGVWYSRGDGDFDFGGTAFGVGCEHLLDLNGDGRADCVVSSPKAGVGSQVALVADGGGHLLGTQNFNLNVAGYELTGLVPNTEVPNMGFITADIDGDGRGDILRWSDNPAANAVYLSNGDGTFRVSDFNLVQGNNQLQKSDGSASFVVGDFTGNGQTEILRTVNTPNGGLGNVLYQKTSTTPPDLLISTVSPTKLTTTLSWASLVAANPPYFSDFNSNIKAVYPVRDLNLPTHVVYGMTSDTGVASGTLTTAYFYAGLKMAYDGRGWLGFREMRTQSPTVNGNYLTVLTEFEQDGVNTGAATLTRTWVGDIWGTNAKVVSNTYNIYCDKTAAADAETNANSGHPCYSSAKVRRPYLYMTQEEGWDLDGTALPVVVTVNSFNDTGDVTKIVNTTTGTTIGQNQVFTKTTDNTYVPNNTAGDKWILGRLKTATVTADNRVKTAAQGALHKQGGAATRFTKPDQIDILTAAQVKQTISTTGTVTNSISRIATTAGSAPYATAIKGVAFSVAVAPKPFKVIGTVAGKLSGTLTATVSGGIAPYQYRWSQIDGTHTTLSSTTIANPVVSATMALGDNFNEVWLLTVTDAANSVISATVPVTLAVPAAALSVKIAPSPLTIDINDPGEGWASLVATPAGGVAPYTYVWARATGTRSTVSDATIANPVVKATLAIGDAFSEQWRVTVTDAAAKTATGVVTVNFKVPPALAVTLAATRAVTANASTGLASAAFTVAPTGGRAPYTYLWERVSGSRSTAADATVANAVISLQMTPGEVISETWQLTVQDAGGHSKAATTVITFNNPATAMGLTFSPSPFKVNANDPGLASGTLAATATGGIPPYSYAWTRATGTRTSVSNAAIPNPVFSATLVTGDNFAETWKLTITDSSGKIYAENVSLAFNAPTALTVPLAATRTLTASAATSGVAAATFTVTPTGGRAPYTYNWARTSGSRSSTPDATDPTPLVSATLAVGESIVENWSVTVTDAVGHKTTATTVVTFNYPAPTLTVSVDPSPLVLRGSDPGTVSDSMTASGKGGIPPYSYSWVHTSGTRTALSDVNSASPVVSATVAQGQSGSEVWTVTVKDSVGKTAAAGVTVSYSVPQVLKAASTAAVQAADATAGNGGVSVAALTGTTSGGTGGNTYQWTRVSGSRSLALNPTATTPGIRATLSLGERVVEDWRFDVTDSAGHVASSVTTVTFEYPGAALVARITPLNETFQMSDPGTYTDQLTATVTGGVAPYSYSWTHVGVGKGTLQGSATSPVATFAVPVGQAQTVNDSWKVTVTDSFGTVISASTTTAVHVPAVLSATTLPTRTLTATVASKGVASGAINQGSVNGGVPPYSAVWTRVSGSRGVLSDPSATSPVVTATLALGETVVENWQATFTDSANHTVTKPVEVTYTYPGQPIDIAFSYTGFGRQLDPGTFTAQVSASVTGGVPPFSYHWRTASSGVSISDASSPTPSFSASLDWGKSVIAYWYLDVVDSIGKTASAQLNPNFSVVSQLTPSLAAKSLAIPATGTGTGSVSMGVTATGGLTPYSYTWTRLSGDRATISNAAIASPVFTATLAKGETVTETWQVEVRDSAGHSATASNTLTFKRAAAARALSADEEANEAGENK
ncbi:hypothetical protein GTP58_09275 [Duganella sp. CY15W]|uniref:FG-GAP-like repeat-containing protein n=1 Tax=Duganella sp. CY15W TaxID=2692172 RepID=UPI00136C5619|nr:FG-GAP-like repeat-containing protein [Duganella sp. CY15W]MYM28512.1 hypothetical protein [Duganella sp. CY15W]